MSKAVALLSIAIILVISSCAINIDRYRSGMPKGMSVCADCHVSKKDGAPYDRGRALLGNAAMLCISCHSERIAAGEHRVGVMQTSKTVLPLYDGRVECPTCHEPHGLEGNRSLLRLPASQICQSCHDK